VGVFPFGKEQRQRDEGRARKYIYYRGIEVDIMCSLNSPLPLSFRMDIRRSIVQVLSVTCQSSKRSSERGPIRRRRIR
jgi:hypothetical protein